MTTATRQSETVKIADGIFWDEQKASEAVKFIETCRHWKGDWAGQKIKLMPWQKQIVRDIWGHVGPDGKRIIQDVYIEVPRKNGKSTLLSAVAVKGLFHEKEPGAELYTAADDRDQAKIVWKSAKKMVERTPALEKRAEIKDYKNLIEYPEYDGELKPRPKNPGKQEGLNIFFLIYDELHVISDQEEYNSLTSATGTRSEPITFRITTAGNDKNSICGSEHEYTKKVNAGEANDPSYYGVIFSADDQEYSFPQHWYDPDHPSHPENWRDDAPRCWETSEDTDWTNEKSWYAANPALERETDSGTVGFRKYDQLKKEVERAEEKPLNRVKVKQKFLNIWTSPTNAFLRPDEWSEIGINYRGRPFGDLNQSIYEYLEGRQCTMGIDLSSKSDLTALVLVFSTPKGVFFIPEMFAPRTKIFQMQDDENIPFKDWRDAGFIQQAGYDVIDYEPAYDQIEEWNNRYKITEAPYDPWGAQEFWQNVQERFGVTCVKYPQTMKYLAPPTSDLYKRVKEGSIYHPENPAFTWQIENCVVYEDNSGYMRPKKDESEAKIDGVIALLMALDRITRSESDEPDINKTIKERGGLL